MLDCLLLTLTFVQFPQIDSELLVVAVGAKDARSLQG